MKGLYTYFILLICFLLVGCNSEETTMQSEDDNIHILYDIEQIQAREDASIYKAGPFQASEELLYDAMIQYEADNEISEVMNAYGKMYYIIQDGQILDSLCIYDEQAEVGLYGGFAYGLWTESMGEKNYQDIVVLHDTRHPNLVEQLIGYNAREDYAKWKDLEFQSINDTLKIMENIFKEASLPKLQVANVYALDAETMNLHASLEQPYENEIQEDLWRKENEAYLLYYRQVIDEIPLINHIWLPVEESRGTYVSIIAAYSAQGLVSLDAMYMLSNMSKQGSCALLSPQEAEKAMRDYYRPVSLTSEIFVESMELNYVVLNDGKEKVLIPAYVFCIYAKFETEDPYTGETVSAKEYEHYVINAITGERIEGPAYIEE